MFGFKVVHRDKKSNARVGEITTPHGTIKTPAFVPVGTQASVKSLTPTELKEIGVQLFFVNTYHMYLRPGIDVVEKLGGIHLFMGWDGPIISDSGGFQVFSLGRRGSGSGDAFFEDARQYSSIARMVPPSSLNEVPHIRVKQYISHHGGRDFSASQNGHPIPPSELVKIIDNGVEFRSHWDGSKHIFTPENSMERQWKLGSDIHIAFDDCTSYPVTHAVAKQSMERTHGWAERSLEEHNRLRHSERSEESPANASSNKLRDPSAALGMTKNYQALYGSIQGSVYEDLRKESAKFISSMDFDGIAIGGVAVGESKEEMRSVLDWVVPFLPERKPRHLLGVGEIDDILDLVEHGIDTFDCVQPTRLGRMGRVYINTTPAKRDPRCCNPDKNREQHRDNTTNRKWEIDITKKEFAEDVKPIDQGCQCYTCTHFSRAYIHHLFRVRELLAYRLATYHNLWFIHRLVSGIRQSIKNGTFVEFKKKWI
ncbi:queuine tRNA-ribosyltransferase [Candidatus Gottesmanbacteria bacterium]|nr:queuine tRNA-ribosyltransferase [Candidatus Gottesmanbacteria bacterium]